VGVIDLDEMKKRQERRKSCYLFEVSWSITMDDIDALIAEVGRVRKENQTCGVCGGLIVRGRHEVICYSCHDEMEY
jgi:hypothetical protein